MNMRKRILSKSEIKSIYDRWGSDYDRSLWLFNLVGFRYRKYRKEAINRLNLKTGDTVVDLGCGTGLNFDLLEENIGPEGTLIGVDLSESMLQKARQRVQRKGWRNITLTQADMADFAIPQHADAVLSTAALTMSPKYDQIIQYVANNLEAGNRMSIFEFKKPERWPEWLIRLTIKLLKPYGVRTEHTKRTPWFSMEKHFPQSSMKEYYFGVVHVATGMA